MSSRPSIITGSWTARESSTSVEDGTNDAHYRRSTSRLYHNAHPVSYYGVETALAINTELWDTAGNAASGRCTTLAAICLQYHVTGVSNGALGVADSGGGTGSSSPIALAATNPAS